ncbi:hypothetical protein TKK_0006090 [Trichogramma kaykai]
MTTTQNMTGLKPPEPLTELTMEGYTKWKQRFELYRIATGADKLGETVQVALLIHCMGEQCLDVYNFFQVNEEEKNMIL